MILLTRVSGETILINTHTILFAQQVQQSDSTHIRVVIGDEYYDFYVLQNPYTISLLAKEDK